MVILVTPKNAWGCRLGVKQHRKSKKKKKQKKKKKTNPDGPLNKQNL